jgi:O-antigen ligase
MASTQASTAFERASSVGQLGSDSSLQYRVVESQIVADQIGARPLTGYGFGATITWGVKNTFSTQTTPFIHNGYLWLAWKIGIPAAAIFVLLLGRAVLRRFPGRRNGEWPALWRGSHASLIAVMLICVTFPVFNALGITAVMGLLAAVCYSASDPPTVPRPIRCEGVDRSRRDE